MALLESKPGALGQTLPEFKLNDPFGNSYASNELAGPKGLLIGVTCNHCPYAKAVWGRLIDIAAQALSLGIKTVAINPNLNPAYPDDSPEAMKAEIKIRGINFPYLVDEDQSVARELGAVCTPEFFLYNSQNILVYHGRLDDNWQDEAKVTRQELLEAVKALGSGTVIAEDQRPAMGCSIKWVE
ncbi:MAG TPA: thioredoxin family protein [Myxococcota bacterium]|nr:thioredoxin family protein [Myxococcota bacterium]MBP8971060.1 thioredoxin family protein [Myxococcota bacterium]HHW97533.1 thioredoxin family protein [Oligoflexales bacterium]HQC43728.1 thioredoxin family protein [Myxococcota bacterium]HQL57822.1 thioredoxin family protein [Myxococcota bacterium]